MRGKVLFATAAPVAGSCTASVLAAAFGSGHLVVVQDGDGAAALTSNATAAFLNEYTTAGGSVQQIALPTTPSGSNKRLTLSGSATSEGFLTLSANGQYLTVAGYDAATTTASITTSNPNTINRVIGRIDLAGNVDTSTAFADNTATYGNPRSAVSSNGTDMWLNTSAAGIRYSTFGTTNSSSVQLSTSPTNVRVNNIFSGQLYTTSASGTFQGVATVGSGLPTTTGQTTTLLNGFPTATGPSPYDYWFANPTTLYVADDRATASSGGIQKWALSSGTWSLLYTITGGATTGVRGLAATTDVSGNAILYATTAEASANKLVTISDLISATVNPAGTYTTLSTAPANTAFRGVELLPVPEPATISLLVLGSTLLVRRRSH